MLNLNRCKGTHELVVSTNVPGRAEVIMEVAYQSEIVGEFGLTARSKVANPRDFDKCKTSLLATTMRECLCHPAVSLQVLLYQGQKICKGQDLFNPS